jgi:hypothetical protein
MIIMEASFALPGGMLRQQTHSDDPAPADPSAAAAAAAAAANGDDCCEKLTRLGI